jgi:uncharacterized phage protein (TIGR01671 family)
MSRILRFRFWHTTMRRFIGLEAFLGEGYGDLNDIDPAIQVSQFTGLLDRDGRDIYEGDVLRIQHPDNVGGDFGDTLGRVFWYKDGWAHGNQSGRPPKTMWEYSTVVGNVYQHPNLLQT